jgi:hypothetical protein
MDPLVTITPSANLCKVLHNFVDICIRRQNFAELTPVHLMMGADVPKLTQISPLRGEATAEVIRTQLLPVN